MNALSKRRFGDVSQIESDDVSVGRTADGGDSVRGEAQGGYGDADVGAADDGGREQQRDQGRSGQLDHAARVLERRLEPL